MFKRILIAMLALMALIPVAAMGENLTLLGEDAVKDRFIANPLPVREAGDPHFIKEGDEYFAFGTGGPIGFSSDLTKLAPDAVEMLAEFVAEFKKNREFWMKASCRVLTDTQNVLTLQYSDETLDKAVVVVFIKTIMQRKVQVFPVLDMAASYQLQDGSVMTAAQIDAEGLWADVSVNQDEGNNHARFFFLEKKG